MHVVRSTNKLVARTLGASRTQSSTCQCIIPLCHNINVVRPRVPPSNWDGRRQYSDEANSNDDPVYERRWRMPNLQGRTLKDDPPVYMVPKREWPSPPEDGPEIQYQALVQTGHRRLVGHRVLSNTEAAEIYKDFTHTTAILAPQAPTDEPGEPQEVHLLYSTTSKPPERMLEDLRRMVFSPDYTVARNPGTHTVDSSTLQQEKLGLFSKKLPATNQPMLRVYKNWKIANGGTAIERVFRFSRRLAALSFLDGVEKFIKVKIRNQAVLEHNPEYAISGRRVLVRWGTHEPQKGISGFDIFCAKQSERWAAKCEVKDVLPEVVDMTFTVTPKDRSELSTSQVLEQGIESQDKKVQIPSSDETGDLESEIQTENEPDTGSDQSQAKET